MRVTDYGARIIALFVPDRNGRLINVVRGYEDVAEYALPANIPNAFGACIGRYANRIKDGLLPLEGQTYSLTRNSGTHCLHGGQANGWQHRLFEAQSVSSSEIRMILHAEDGENGFPGNVTAVVTYRLLPDNTLDIHFEATTDRTTVINLTNHNYYNLSGDFTRPIDEHVLCVHADFFLPISKECIPTGEMRPVAGTPMDFRTPHTVGTTLHEADEQLANGIGYDHNYCLNTYKDGHGDDTQVCATLYCPQSGILMEMRTNEPGMQLYSGNWEEPKRVAICLESQKYPDSPHHPEWPSPVVKPGETYHSHTAYTFKTQRI